ncbi:MAG TPA: histidinol dehydrogenase [Phycisphaerae bacterium]|nr:histidinol dehydrogenase [Phycisphaerae bacterium]
MVELCQSLEVILPGNDRKSANFKPELDMINKQEIQMPIPIYHYQSDSYESDVSRLLDKLQSGSLVSSDTAGQLDVPSIVADIISEVSTSGDAAAARLTSKLDNAQITPETIRVEPATLRRAHDEADRDFLDLVRRVSDNIRQYQQAIIHKDPPPLRRGGRSLGVRYTPIDRVGVYVPGGKGLYPSTLLMTVVPAQVAGVGQIAITSPPTGGEISPMVLALAEELGISEVYRLGGAVGISALACGTETIKPVSKIVGPGSAFVAESKRQLLGRVGIDSTAGPSEVLIVADDSARPDWLAADLLAQAEHDPGSAILVTTSQSLANAVSEQLKKQLPLLQRAQAAGICLEKYGAIIVTSDIDRACEIANDFATEHLQLITSDNQAIADKITNAGAIFMGPFSPVPVGDYYAGPSHVLPTGGTAKFFSPMSCNDFLKASSIISYDGPSLAEDAEDIINFASREGFSAHAQAVNSRKEG